jgi:hypothetical protein
MSPTIFKVKSYRFFFFSREENRLHVHVTCPDGEAKFWIEPVVALANYDGLTLKQIREIQNIIEERSDEVTKAWKKHFKS